MVADQPLTQFSTWLLRPYFDLGPFHEGPLHVRAVEEGWTAFAKRARSFQPQRALAPAFRAQLGRAAPPYALTDPRELPDARRTPRWQAVCDALDVWTDLADDQRCRLASLLLSMCLYKPLLALIPEVIDVANADERGVELAWSRAAATYMLGLTTRASDYHDADVSPFERIVLDAPDAGRPTFNAAVRVFVHKAKTGASVSELAHWGERLEEALASATSGMDAFAAGLLTSRFHRAMGFLPRRIGDRNGVVDHMDTAERLARALVATTAAERVLYGENLHAVMESRAKEALWIGDTDAALVRARCVTEVDPFDAKAWVEVGEVLLRRKDWREAARAYATAATLGPPATAVARHMAAVCLRELGDDHVAALLLRDSLEADPLGISPREEIATLPDALAFAALREWSRTTVEW